MRVPVSHNEYIYFASQARINLKGEGRKHEAQHRRSNCIAMGVRSGPASAEGTGRERAQGKKISKTLEIFSGYLHEPSYLQKFIDLISRVI